jgi:hypothetical protein
MEPISVTINSRLNPRFLTSSSSAHEDNITMLVIACYYSVQSLLSSHLMSRNVKVKIYKTIILPVVLYGYETWSLTFKRRA